MRAPGERGRGDQRERERTVREVLRRRAERVVERVAHERERCRPRRGAEQRPREEGAQAHARRAGEERGDRAHEADEAPDQDRLAAVAVEELLDALEPRRGDAEPRAVRDQEAPPEAAAEPEAREVAERGGDPRDQRASAAGRRRPRPRRRRRARPRSRPGRRARRTRRSRGTRARRRARRSRRRACRRGRSARPRGRAPSTTPAWTSANSAAPEHAEGEQRGAVPAARSASAGA